MACTYNEIVANVANKITAFGRGRNRFVRALHFGRRPFILQKK